MLSPAELARYNRQLLLPELGLAGQERLKRARVLVVGAGGLGSPVILYLAAAGVGTLGIADSDRVDPGNLHRQIVHGTDDVGRDKTASAADSARRLNPDVKVVPHVGRLDDAGLSGIIGDYDLLVDGSDNYPTRYAINDVCARNGTPWVYGSVERFSGQVSVFGVPGGPCYRCLFPDPPDPGSTPNCDEIGVLGAVPGAVGAMQAVEALKQLSGIGTSLSGRLMQIDFLRGDTRWITVERRSDCTACRSSNREHVKKPSLNSGELPDIEIAPSQVSDRLRALPAAHLVDVREPWEVQRASIAGATVLPMNTVEQKLDSLSREEELIVFCHHGGRSRVVVDWLRSQGFAARNMTGGIDRWSREVDPGVPRY